MGIGDLDQGFYNRTTGMGETGIAYRSNWYIINNNPASFSALTNQFFTMETSIRGTLCRLLRWSARQRGQAPSPAISPSADW